MAKNDEGPAKKSMQESEASLVDVGKETYQYQEQQKKKEQQAREDSAVGGKNK